MKKSFELLDTKLNGRSQTIIRIGFMGAALILVATLLGATVAANFDATYIKVSLAIMTIPAYVYYFLSGFCCKVEVRPADQKICYYPLLKKRPTCFDTAAVSSIRKKILQKNRILYQFKVENSKFTICTDQQGALERLFKDRFQ